MKKYWSDLDPIEKRELAKKLKTTAGYLRQIFVYGKKPGYRLAIDIECTTGIHRSELRPDIYPPEEYKQTS